MSIMLAVFCGFIGAYSAILLDRLIGQFFSRKALYTMNAEELTKK